MKVNNTFFYLNLLNLMVFGNLAAQSSTMGSSSTMSSSSPQLQTMPPLEKPTPVKPPEQKAPPPTIAPPVKEMQQATYFYPGIVVNRGGAWEGGDDLLNLTNNIGFYLSIIKPDNDPLKIDEAQLKKMAENLFQSVGISPKILVAGGQAPLPFFQVQILLYPIGHEGYVACCEGRLFESVSLKRIFLDASGMAFQAVTWQKSSLIISPNSQITQQIQQHVNDIVKAFTERYQSFANIKRT